jgi:hypothetical protein
MNRFFTTAALVCFAAVAASGQTKISGTAQCGKADPQHMIPVGDRPDHTLGVAQAKCTWTKPMEIEGAKSKDGVSTLTNDISGDTARAHGFHVSTMDSGDKFFVWYQETATMKDGALVSSKGTWGFTGGSGKLKGIKGKGTYTCTPSGDGSSCEVEGDYQLGK